MRRMQMRWSYPRRPPDDGLLVAFDVSLNLRDCRDQSPGVPRFNFRSRPKVDIAALRFNWLEWQLRSVRPSEADMRRPCGMSH
jgi:hypothetical protein